MPTIRLLLIDDHALFRSGMRLILLEGLADIEVLEADSLELAVRTVTQAPALVLLDIQLQGVNGLEGLALIQARWPQSAVIMLSSRADPQTVQQALARGAAAFVSKADTACRIVQVIRQVLGRDPQSAAGDKNIDQSTVPEAGPRLTPRQCEVLDLLCEGCSNKVIAQRLKLSEFTVRGHVQAVLGLLGVSSRSQATAAARRFGLVG